MLECWGCPVLVVTLLFLKNLCGDIMLTQERLISILIGIFIGAILTAGGMTLMNRTQPAPIIIHPPEPTATIAPTETPGPIQVFVNGQVLSAAVYELPANSIVEDAIGAAGGFTDEANTAVVNLAQALADGAQVYVPALDEDVAVVAVINSAVATTGNSTSTDADMAVANSGGLININTATIEALDALPGVGPSTAQKIVDHREENGLFTTIEDIMDVSGIGEAKFGQIEALITVEGE